MRGWRADDPRYQSTTHDGLLRDVYHAISNSEQKADVRQVKIIERIHDIQAASLATSVKGLHGMLIKPSKLRVGRTREANLPEGRIIEETNSTAHAKCSSFLLPTKAIGMPLPLDSPCTSGCKCTCHAEVATTRTSGFAGMLVWLVVRASLAPRVANEAHCCNQKSCRKRSLRYAYNRILPQWLADQRKLLLVMAFSTLRGPELCLKIPRIRPWKSAIFSAARSGDLRSVQQYLMDGTASVVDMDLEGRTALFVTFAVLVLYARLTVTSACPTIFAIRCCRAIADGGF